MFFKNRTEPVELKILRSLNTRINLPPKEKQYLSHLEKGYEGERKVDVWLKSISDKFFILNDLLLEHNHTTFQIDTLLISEQTIYIFEIKNYEGDFCIEDDNWYTVSGNELKNPLLQLKRTQSLFRQLLHHMDSTFHVEAYLLFINPEFTLYQASKNLPIIFPTQMNRFMKKLNMSSPKLNQRHKQLAKKLLARHARHSSHLRFPDYTYEHLIKGVTCTTCFSFLSYKEKKLSLECGKCGSEENVEHAILRSVEEFKLLFPTKKITTNTIHEWCAVIKSKKTVRRILNKHFYLIGHGNHSYFVY